VFYSTFLLGYREREGNKGRECSILLFYKERNRGIRKQRKGKKRKGKEGNKGRECSNDRNREIRNQSVLFYFFTLLFTLCKHCAPWVTQKEKEKSKHLSEGGIIS